MSDVRQSPSGPDITITASEVVNDSSVAGANVALALDALEGAIPAPLHARVTQLGWQPTAALQTSNLLTVLPAGHTPGMYLIAFSNMIRVVGGAGNLQETWNWSDGGAQTLSSGASAGSGAPSTGALGLARIGVNNNVLRTIYSDGISPITAQLTIQGAVTTPTIDVMASATLIGLP